MHKLEILYPISLVARLSGHATDTLRAWEKRGRLKVVRSPTGRRMVPESEVRRLLDGGERA